MKQKEEVTSHQLIYIGSSFYIESGTMMSPIYSEDWDRWDFGDIKMALERGEEVNIRPATEIEMTVAYAMLRKEKKYD